jgi:hypothetical protein
MTGLLDSMHRRAFFIAAVSCTILGVFRLSDRGNDPYDGYATDGNNTVTQVDAGGPAGRAGLKAGDRIRGIDGIPAEDARTRARRARPAIGQPTTLEVERGGAGSSDAPPFSLSLSFTHAAPPGDFAARNFAGFLIGLCFVLCGLAACFKVPSRSGRILALAGLCLGAAFLGFPYFSSYSVRLLAQAILGLALVLGFASLFHFMLEFPKPKAFLRRKHALTGIYGPALLIALYLLILVIVQPPSSSALSRWSNLLFGLFLVAYFGGAAAAMAHSYLKATPAERAHYGLRIQLAGILLGILPIAVEVVLRILMPMLVLPGSDLYFLTVAFIPVALVTAILRQQHGARLSVREA